MLVIHAHKIPMNFVIHIDTFCHFHFTKQNKSLKEVNWPKFTQQVTKGAKVYP